jgi:hypothetical protein
MTGSNTGLLSLYGAERDFALINMYNEVSCMKLGEND